MAVLEKSPVAAASAPAAPCTNVSLFKPFLFRRETICVNVSLHRVRILQGTATKQQKSSAPVDEDDDDEGSEMELDEDFPDINAAPHIRFERFDRDDDLIIEFDNMFSTTGTQDFPFHSYHGA